MWIALGRRLVLGASLLLLASPLAAQPELTGLQPADGALLAARTGTLTGQADGAVLLRVDGHDLTLGGDGSFSYVFSLPEGESALSLYAEDAAGVATSVVHHLEVDSQAPGIVVSAPAQTRVAASPVEVAGTVQDPHLSSVTVRGSPAGLSGNSFSASVSLAEGPQNVAIVATDSLGHSSTVTLVLTLDTAAPAIGVSEAGVNFTGGLFKRPVTPVITFTDAGSYTTEVLLDGSPYSSGTVISSEGAHQLEITATDGVGNSASREIGFTLDFSAPGFGTVSPAAGALISAATVTLQVEATGATSVKVGSQQGSARGNVYTIGPITLAEGSQELVIEAFDAAGNRAERRHGLIRDTTAPALQIVAPAQNAVLTSSPATISGTATDPRLASVRVNGVLASLSGADFSISQALEEGANAFEIVALDSAGNSTTQTLGLTLDTTAPSFTVKVGGVALAGGEVFSTAITPTIELSEPAATVTATLDGASFTFGSPISADGNHQLAVTVTHNSLSSSNLFSFRIDRQAPVFGALLPAEGSVLAATSVLLEGAVTGAASLTVDGAAVALDGGAFAAGPYTLTAGASRTFVLLARSAGGLTTERRLTVVQDGTAPQLVIQQPAAAALLGAATVSVSGSATDPHLSRVRVSGVDAQVSASSWLASGISLAEGSNTLTVVAEDRAGNQTQLTRTVVRDTTDPEIVITEPAAGTVVPAARYTLRGTATDAHLDRVEVDGRRATLAGSAFSLEVTLAEGANSFEAAAIDKLGRRKTATVSITRDSEAPQVLIVEPAEGFATRSATLTVRGAYENEAGTTVKVNGINAVLTTGHFEVAAIPLAPGENRITARAVDVQGNEGVHTRLVIRDEVAPTFLRLEPSSGALALPLATVFRITFSEDMAAPAPGALTLATLAGSPLGFTTVVDGDDLVVTPASPLPPQTTLRLTLTAALTDRAGNALAPVPAAFELTTADTGAPGAPVLTTTPAATGCRREVELTGTAEASSQVKVTGGAAAAVARAGENGAFTLLVELPAEQTSVLRLTATDALGNVSPELVLSLAADCTPPQVADAQLAGAVVTVEFSEPVTTLATAFRLASTSGAESFTFALSGDTATLTLASPPAGLLELAVGEAGGTAVADLAGNSLAFPWRRLFGAGGGDSFLAGTVFDDGRGQPLEGVVASVTSTGGVPLADPLPQVTTGADGRFLLGLPAGTHDVTFARPGYSPVFRVVTTTAGEGSHVFDPRLTLLSLPQPIGAAGGELAAEGARLEVPAGAFASSQATSLTVLSEQALPSLLPFGFSPRGAVYVNFGATLAAPATLSLPVDTVSGREVVIATLDFALLQWKALAVRTVSGATLEIEIEAPGAYVIVEADAESASLLEPVIGQVLPSLAAPEGDEIEAAEVEFSPTQVLPSQRSRATVSYTLTDPGTPAPSGLPLTLGVQERLTLLDGSERRAVPYSADLLVFRAPNGDPRSRFWLQPSALAASLPIEIGAEDVTVRTFGETTVRGNILGPDGGSVLGSGGDLFEVPAGALTKPTAVTVQRRTVGDLPHAPPAGYPVLGVLEVELGGIQLAGVGRLTLATDDPPAAGSRGLLLGTEEIDGEPRWRALAELEPIPAGWRTVATGGSNPPWPGVRQGGLYLAIELEGDWGLLEGELYDTDQELVQGGLISSTAVPFIQLSNANGTYVIPLPAGSAVVVQARDTRHDQVAVEIPALTDGERRVFDLEVLATGPTVVEIEPADGAANVPTTFLPEVTFSESIDRASLDEGIRLTREGEPVAIDIDHQDDRIVIDPVASLLPDTSYTLEVNTAIADLQGRHLVALRSVSFRTQAVAASTPGINADKLLLYEPDYQGLAKIVGLPGAVPADSTIWVESVETITVVAEANGSFELEIPATLGDDIFLTVLVPGQSAAVRLLGPWLLRGDIGAYVDARGGRFKTAAGFEVEVQRDSFEQMTRVTLELKPAPIPASPRLSWIVDFELDLGGEVTQKPIYVRLPAPANVPAGSTIFLSRFVEALGRRGWMVMDLLRQDGASLTNALESTAPGSVAARFSGVEATRFENPAERVLPAASMTALRQGDFLPKAAMALGDAERELEALPREAMEAAIAPSTQGQAIGLPGLRVSGRYQVTMTAQEVAWIRFSMKIWRHLSMVLGDEVAFFVVVVADLLRLTGIGELLAPRLADESVEVGMYDLTTGYEVYREVLPPTQEPIYTLPPGNYGDTQPPSVVEASPLRFSLIQTAAAGTVEVHSGISATVTEDRLTIRGTAGSAGSRVEVKLFDIDAAAGAVNLDKSVRSSEQGDFVVETSGFVPGKRFLLAIGGTVGPSARLTLRFSEVVPATGGIEIFTIAADGKVAKDPVELSRTPLDRGAAWQFVPVSGWRAGKYQLRLTTNFGDEAGNHWPREFTLEFEVPRSSSAASIPVTRFADFDRLGNLLAVASADAGLRLFDVSNPANPQPFLSADQPYRFAGGGAVRGIAIDSHGRIVVVGSGEQFAGQLHVIDPLALDREAPLPGAWTAGVWGHTSITNPLGGHSPFPRSGMPRRVTTMNLDRTDKWQVGEAAPLGLAVTLLDIPDSEDKNLKVTGSTEKAKVPVSLHNVTRGRWNRVESTEASQFDIEVRVRPGDAVELRRSRTSWAYVSIDGGGIATVDLAGTHEVQNDEDSLDLLSYTNGFRLDATACDGSPNVDSTPVGLEVALADGEGGNESATLVTLVQGYGLALYQIDPMNPGNLAELSSACAAVEGGRALVTGMEVLSRYPMDLNGDGRIREREETTAQGTVLPRELRNYVVVAHIRGYVLIFDITTPATPKLVSRIKIGKPDEIIQISGVAVDRVNRKIYVGAFGSGLYAVDFNVLGGLVLRDADHDELDDRVTENIQVGDEELVDALAFPELGIIWGGGRRNGVAAVAVGGPQLKLITGEGAVLREVSRLAPLGVPTAPEGGKNGSPDYPASFQAQVTVGSAAPELAIEVKSLGATGLELPPARTDVEGLPSTQLAGDKAVKLVRQSENPWEAGSTLYLSEPVVVIADLRAAVAYSKTEDEEEACSRCDQVEEKLYDAPPEPSQYLPELLSGHRVAVDWASELLPALRNVYGNLLTGKVEAISVPWEMSPAVQQEPALNASKGYGDVAAGTLLHSGELSHDVTDLSIPGLGFDFVFTRTYRSQTIGNGPLGPGWDHNWNMHLRELPNGDVELYDGRGRRDLVFTPDKEKYPQLRPSVGLRPHTQGFTLTDEKGNHFQFDRLGRLLAVVDPLKRLAGDAGSELKLSYDVASRLVGIEAHGRGLDFEYDDDGHLEQVKDFTGRVWKYHYDDQGRLTGVDTPVVDLGEGVEKSLKTRYAYVSTPGSGLAQKLAAFDDLDTIVDARQVTALDVGYQTVESGERTRVVSQVLGGGPGTVALTYADGLTTVTDRRGKTRQYDHDDYGHLTRFTDPLGNVTQWTFVDFEAGLRNGLAKEVLLPDGRKTEFEHEQAVNSQPDLRRISNLLGIKSHPGTAAPSGVFPLCEGPTIDFEPLKAFFFGHSELVNAPAEIEGPAGQRVSISRDSKGVVKSIRSEASGTAPLEVQMETDARGLPTSSSTQEVVAGGGTRTVTTSSVYADETGYLESETTTVGGTSLTTRYQHDERGNVIRVEQPGGIVGTSKFNELDWLLEECGDATGRNACTRFTYDENGRPTRIDEPFGFGEHVATRIVYGPRGEIQQIFKEVKPGGPELLETRTYDENLNVLEIDPPAGGKTVTTYDDRGLVETVQEHRGSSEPITTTYEYNSTSQVISVVEGAQTWQFEYDGLGRQKSTKDPLGTITFWKYDENGKPIEESTCSLNEDLTETILSKVTRSFDQAGRLSQEMATAQAPGRSTETLTSTYAYDNRSRLISAQDPSGVVQQTFYDEKGRVRRQGHPLLPSGMVEYAYFDNQRRVESTATVGDQTVTSSVEYDGLGLPVTRTNGMGQTTTYEYDDAGLLRRVVLPDGNFFAYTYDGLGRPLSTTQPEGIEEHFVYQDGAETRSETYRDAFGQSTVSQYGKAGELLSVTYPDGTATVWEYDLRGNPIKITRPDLEIEQTFDANGRLVSRVRTEGDGQATNEAYDWDGIGRPTLATVGGKTSTWQWDSASRLLEQGQGSRSVVYTPDGAGAPESTLYPSGQRVNRAYNGIGALGTVRLGADLLASFSQQGAGLVTSSVGPLTGVYQYEAAGRLRRSYWNTTQQVLDEELTYDSRGLPVARNRRDLLQTWDYDYDGAARVVSAEQKGAPTSLTGLFSYEYDAAQNLLRKQRTSACGETITPLPLDGSGRNRPGSVAGTELEWDARGRLVEKGDLRFQYDDRDRLAVVRRQLDEETTELVATYEYDIEGRRVEREVGGINTQTVWDGWQAIEDFQGANLVGQRVYGQGYDEILQLGLPLGSGELTAYHPVYDSIGNLTALVRPNGDLVERYDYTPYGGRIVTGNDNQPPRLEQIRLEDDIIHLQLSEPTVKAPASAILAIQNLSRDEQPILSLQAVTAEGRQYGRQIAFKNGGDPAEDPPNWPQPGDNVRIVVAAGAFEDSFGNVSQESEYASVVWPAADAALADTTPPRLEEICAQGNTLKLTFSEPVSATLAATAISVDGAPATWARENAGYTLTVAMAPGSHSLAFTTAPLDLAGLGFPQSATQSFTTAGNTKSIYSAPFPGEAGDSLVGNPYGFQGLPQDTETGFLYVRHRYYDPELGRFITPDPMGYTDGPNQYQFALNDPIVNRDPTGEVVETLWDVANVGMGLYSVYHNLKQGELGLAALDGLGIVVDSLAALVPFVPGGVGASLKAARCTQAFQTAQLISRTSDVAQGVGQSAQAYIEGNNTEAALYAGMAGLGAGGMFRKNPCNCFAAGTLVATETGFTPIEKIQIGDQVWSLDEESGEIGLKAVVKTFENDGRPIFELEVQGGDGVVNTTNVTGEHPFWVEGQGWVAAEALNPGDRLRTNTTAWLEVLQLRGPPTIGTTYNFEVEDNHTYFVSPDQLLVHNKCPSDFAKGWQGTGDYKGIDDFEDVILRKGTIIYGGFPGPSNFFMPVKTFRRSGGSAAKLWKSLQVMESDRFIHPITGGYRSQVKRYRLKADIPAARARALANGRHGKGGALQYAIQDDYLDMLEEIRTISLRK